jgi:hypothetical protein
MSGIGRPAKPQRKERAQMMARLATAAAAASGIPGLRWGDMPFPARQIAGTSAFITIPLGILLIVLAGVFWRGRYLGLIAGYKEYGVAYPKRMGRFVGALITGLGAYQLIFPLTILTWGPGAFVAFVVVVVGVGVAILIGGAYFERG